MSHPAVAGKYVRREFTTAMRAYSSIMDDSSSDESKLSAADVALRRKQQDVDNGMLLAALAPKPSGPQASVLPEDDAAASGAWSVGMGRTSSRQLLGGGLLEEVARALAMGAEASASGGGGVSALMLATDQAEASVVELLLLNGAHVDAVDGRGRSALHHVAVRVARAGFLIS